MGKLFRKLTIRTIKTNFKQFVSVILIVLLGVMLLTGFITNSHTLKKGIDNYFEESNLAKTWLQVDGVKSEDEQFFQSEGINYNKRFYYETNSQIEEKTGINLTKLYVFDIETNTISKPCKESGNWEGCLIDKNVAKKNGVEITFDTLVVDFTHPIYGVTLKLEFNISGSMNFDECADTYSSWPVFIDNDLFLAELNSKVKKYMESNGLSSMFSPIEMPYNQILLDTDDEAVVSKVKNYYETSQSKLQFVFDRNYVESVVLLNSEVSQSKKMIYVFPIIFLIVSILVILTTIDQLVLQERQKIGTLKSIGVPDKKILRYYSKFGALLCLIGATIGAILGMLIIPKIMMIKYNLVYSIPQSYLGLKIPVLWILLVLVCMVLLGYLVSFSTCHKILHKKPVECLRFELGTRSKVFKKKKINLKNFPLSLKMANRNLRLKPVRALMATIGIAGCVALLLCGFGIGNTLNNSVNNDYKKVFSFDITTTFNVNNFEDELKKVNGVNYFEKFDKFRVEAQCKSEKKNINAFSIEPNSKFTQFKLEEGEVFLSKSIADSFDIKEGDIVTLFDGTNSLEFTVTKIGETSIMNGLYFAGKMEFNNPIRGMWISSENPNLVVDEVNKINGTNGASTMDKLIDQANNQISSIDLMTTTIKVFAIFLAIIVLLNLIFLILNERTRELATLKVLGKDLISISLSIYFEVLFMVILGLVAGMALGYPLLVLVLTVNKIEIVNFIYKINFSSFIYTILIVILTHVLMTIFSYRKIKKINMIESLKSVE